MTHHHYTARRYEMDMTTGPILPKMLSFAGPLMLTGILQLLYNAADIVVVGNFAGAQALAAVGSTGSLINLLVNVFMGLSVGASVLVAHSFGAGDLKRVQDGVHTSITVALIAGLSSGVNVVTARFLGAEMEKDVRETVHTAALVCPLIGLFMLAVGVIFSRGILEIMGTKDVLIDGAALYLRIYFLGMPANMLYNFGAAILRAVGDTRRPLIYLTISGLVNVALNLVLVIGFKLDVAGVAIVADGDDVMLLGQ